ncbi:MAG: NAD(P)/FAD-dependent oxidoreductase, partial [Verrucomicrobiaceae bacterium]
EFIDDAVSFADPMVLRGLLYLLTSDEDLTSMDVASSAELDASITDVVSEADMAMLRAKAADFIKSYRDKGAPDVELGSPDHILRSLNLTAGFEIPAEDRDIWFEQAVIDPWARGIKWKEKPSAEQLEDFFVMVVGTGLSGLNTAAQLKRAGVPYVVVEKNAEIGGSWFENRYPGARVDTCSRGYTHSIGVNYPYPYAFCPRDEVLKYLNWVADEFDIREDVVLNTEVTSMVWDEASQKWCVTGKGPEGERIWQANAIITCVGFLSRPHIPEIEGAEKFLGTSCHSAAWPDGLDVAGKRVAVIGSGASGYQTTPVIAKTAAHTTLFQRTPAWCYPDRTYLSALPEQLLWLEQNVPFYSNFARFALSAERNPESVKMAVRTDPDFVDEHARSAANKAVRDGCVAYLKEQLASKPELIEKMIPKAPPMSSRPIRVDVEDNIFKALRRDNATLVSDPIEEITSAGILAGGKEYPQDIIVYATGFKAHDYMWPMEIRGRNGVRIEEVWERDGPRAYLGTMVPGFPNFFMVYGPNTNNFGGFQVMDLLELCTAFALRNIAGLIEQGKQSVDVSEDAYWRYNGELDEAEKDMLYLDPRANSYYQ